MLANVFTPVDEMKMTDQLPTRRPAQAASTDGNAHEEFGETSLRRPSAGLCRRLDRKEGGHRRGRSDLPRTRRCRRRRPEGRAGQLARGHQRRQTPTTAEPITPSWLLQASAPKVIDNAGDDRADNNAVDDPSSSIADEYAIPPRRYWPLTRLRAFQDDRLDLLDEYIQTGSMLRDSSAVIRALERALTGP